jgi:cholesterol transport system auxiliary component
MLPKARPAQLYRFGEARTTPAAPSRSRFTVQMLPIDFDRASAGDLILTVSGDEAAYIKGARWVTSASSEFEGAVATTFAGDQGAAHLMAHGEVVRPDVQLKLSVRRFEARYTHGRTAPPDIVVELYAALSRADDRTLVGERTFTASIPASDDRMGAIAQAFNQAVGQVLGEMVRWVDAAGSGYAKPA